MIDLSAEDSSFVIHIVARLLANSNVYDINDLMHLEDIANCVEDI